MHLPITVPDIISEMQSFLSLGAESAFIDLGIALPPGRYHSKAALAFKDTLKEVLQAADG